MSIQPINIIRPLLIASAICVPFLLIPYFMGPDFSPPVNCPCEVKDVISLNSGDYHIKVLTLKNDSIQFFYSENRYAVGDVIK